MKEYNIYLVEEPASELSEHLDVYIIAADNETDAIETLVKYFNYTDKQIEDT